MKKPIDKKPIVPAAETTGEDVSNETAGLVLPPIPQDAAVEHLAIQEHKPSDEVEEPSGAETLPKPVVKDETTVRHKPFDPPELTSRIFALKVPFEIREGSLPETIAKIETATAPRLAHPWVFVHKRPGAAEADYVMWSGESSVVAISWDLLHAWENSDIRLPWDLIAVADYPHLRTRLFEKA